jgi:N-acetylglutamate synthase
MEPGMYDALVGLWRSFPGNTLTGADSPEGFRAFLSRNGDCCHAAVDEGAVVGSVMAGEDSRRGYIYHLAVRLSHQGSGIGRALMEKAEGALRNRGIEKVHLFIYSDNPAIGFYEKLGWHVRKDIEIMSRVLSGEEYAGTRH